MKPHAVVSNPHAIVSLLALSILLTCGYEAEGKSHKRIATTGNSSVQAASEAESAPDKVRLAKKDDDDKNNNDDKKNNDDDAKDSKDLKGEKDSKKDKTKKKEEKAKAKEEKAKAKEDKNKNKDKTKRMNTEKMEKIR